MQDSLEQELINRTLNSNSQDRRRSLPIPGTNKTQPRDPIIKHKENPPFGVTKPNQMGPAEWLLFSQLFLPEQQLLPNVDPKLSEQIINESITEQRQMQANERDASQRKK